LFVFFFFLFSSFIVRTATFFQGLSHISIFRATQRATKFFISSARHTLFCSFYFASFMSSLAWGIVRFVNFSRNNRLFLSLFLFFLRNMQSEKIIKDERCLYEITICNHCFANVSISRKFRGLS